MSWRRRAALVGAFAAAFALFWWLLKPPPTLMQVACKVLDAQARGDAGTILQWTWPKEVEDTHLDRLKLQKFIDTIYTPAVQGFVPLGPPKVVSEIKGGDLTVAQVMRHPDGRTCDRVVQVRPTDQGPVVTGAVASLYVAAMSAHSRPRQPALGQDGLRVAVEYTTEHLAELKATGITGFVRYTLDQPNVRVQVTTWEEWIASRHKHLEDLQASQRP